MSKDTIFFSYSRDDAKFVLDLAKNLRLAGANIWLDQLDIPAGARWDQAIENALIASNTLLVILSKSSVESNNVMDEVSFALEEGKKVVPVLKEECDIPFRLRLFQYADFTKDQQQGMETIVNALDLDHHIASKLTSVSESNSENNQSSASTDSDQSSEIETPKEPDQKTTEKKTEPKVVKTEKKKSKSKLPILLGIVAIVAACSLWAFKDQIFKDKDQIAWDLTNKGNIMADYEKYISDFPKGKYLKASKDSLKNKLHRIQLKEDEGSWRIAKKQNTAEAYKDYIDLKIPIHNYVEQAQVKYDSINNYNQLVQKDHDAWKSASVNATIETIMGYIKNEGILGAHRNDALDLMKKIGKSGWLFVGRTNGGKFTEDQIINIIWKKGQAEVADDALPKVGDIIKLKSSAGSRTTYRSVSDRSARNKSGSWNKNHQAYVLADSIQGRGSRAALMLQVIYPK